MQRFFVWVIGGGDQPAVTTPERYPSFDDLAAYARGSHAAIGGPMSQLSGSGLQERITIPWFTEPPLTLTRADALAQMATL